MHKFFLVIATMALLPGTAFAQLADQNDADAFEKATAVGVCEFGVKTASYSADNEITAQCLTEDEAVTGFVPLLGGFAPALFPALAFLIGVAGNNGSGNATGGTN